MVPARPVVVRAGTAPRHELRFGRGFSEALAVPAIGAGKLLVHKVTIRPGTEPGPYHLHRHAENVYLAMEGILEVIADGRRERLAPGDAIVIPAGIGHATHNPSAEPSVLLAIYDRPIAHDFELVDRPNLGGVND